MSDIKASGLAKSNGDWEAKGYHEYEWYSNLPPKYQVGRGRLLVILHGIHFEK